MRVKHIYWFSYFNLVEPSVRNRAKYPLQRLQDVHDISASVFYPGRYTVKLLAEFLIMYLSALLFPKEASIIVFQKIYTNGFYAKALKFLLRCRRKSTLYDIDDAEYTRHPAETIHYFMKNCAACSAGSESLRRYIERLNQHVFTLTSPVIDHRITRLNDSRTFIIGWVGYYSAHRDSLMELALPAVAQIDFPVTLKLLGVRSETEEKEIRDYFKHNSNVTLSLPRNLDWQDEHSIYEHIKTFDVGLAPLLDTEFNRGKSAFKAKQCLSCGVPVLASSVGENKVFVKNGINGYHCDTPAQYLEKIHLVHSLPAKSYQQLSAAAAASFDTFSIDHFCNTIVGYFERAGNASALMASSKTAWKD